MKYFIFLLLIITYSVHADTRVEITIPRLDVKPYFRPYVVVWIEDNKRKPIYTLGLWYQNYSTAEAGGDGGKWLKDLRQWWRKIGRSGKPNFDAVTGATRKPGKYSLVWDGVDAQGKTLADGEYLLNIEASREEGGRSYHRIPIELGRPNSYTIAADGEFGEIIIVVEN